MKFHKKSSGFIAITPVIVIGAVVLAIAQGIAFRSARQVVGSAGRISAAQASYMANACAETAIIRLQTILGYAGGETVNADGILCDISAIAGSGGTNRTVMVQATVGGYVRKVKVIVAQVSFPLKISSWQEVSDF